MSEEAVEQTSEPKAAGMVEERCPICLDDFQDKAFVASCFHSYCFSCVVKAAQVSGNKCPMCKTDISKIIHNVKANDNYDVYNVPPPESAASLSRRQAQEDFEEAVRNFRGYRTTVRPGRGFVGTNRDTSSSSSGSGSEVGHWGQAAQGGVLVHISLPHSSSASAYVSTRNRPGSSHHHRHRGGYGGRNIRRSQKCAPTSVRRSVYSAGVHALPLDESSSRSRGRKTRDISAAFFKRYPASTHRLGPWLSREFEALLGEEHVEFMMQLVLSLIDKVNLESDHFAAHLEPFLNERTSHFMHELISFAKSPFDIIAYDGKVRYDWPANYQVAAGLGQDDHVGETSSDAGTAGPSSSSTSSGLSDDVQRRIFHEVVNDPDESCYVIGSSSPIVIHDSDSEPDESEVEVGLPIKLERSSQEFGSARPVLSQNTSDEESQHGSSIRCLRSGLAQSSRNEDHIVPVDATCLAQNIGGGLVRQTSNSEDHVLSLGESSSTSTSSGSETRVVQVSKMQANPEEISLFTEGDEDFEMEVSDGLRMTGQKASSGENTSSKGKAKMGTSKSKHKSLHRQNSDSEDRVISLGVRTSSSLDTSVVQVDEMQATEEISLFTEGDEDFEMGVSDSRRRTGRKTEESMSSKGKAKKGISNSQCKSLPPEDCVLSVGVRTSSGSDTSVAQDGQANSEVFAELERDEDFKMGASNRRRRTGTSKSKHKNFRHHSNKSGHRRRHHHSQHRRSRSRSRSGENSSRSRNRVTARRNNSREKSMDKEKRRKKWSNHSPSLSPGPVRRKAHSSRSRESRRDDEYSERPEEKTFHCGDLGDTDSSGDLVCKKGRDHNLGRTKEQLMQEAKAIEDEIRSSKQMILKSALKRERIELLHRNMHGPSISQGDEGGVGVPKEGGVVCDYACTDGMLQDELTELNNEIASKKRRLLKVVKHMEEEYTE